MTQNEKVKQGSKTTKKVYFPIVIQYIQKEHKDLKIESLVDLDFSTLYTKSKEVAAKPKTQA